MFVSISKSAIFVTLFCSVTAILNLNETSTSYILSNDRLSVTFLKSNGQANKVFLDGQDLLGTGRGPYLDCTCTPDGFWTPGSGPKRTLKAVQGIDSKGVPYGGIISTDIYVNTNQSLAQFWFVRQGETSIHMFTRATYWNDTVPNFRTLGEIRTLFRPVDSVWSHSYAGEGNFAPKPLSTSTGVTAQDATTYYGNNKNDPFVQQYSDFFTKYSFSDQWRSHKVHGTYADGSRSNGSTWGAWLIHNTVDTYYGGPLHSDIMVDNIVYNYISSGHHGNIQPTLFSGWERTFGPQVYHFNTKGTLEELRKDAEQYANPTWNADFYDDIAIHVPGYLKSSERTTFRGRVRLPRGAVRPIAILSENGREFQNNTIDPKVKQYWSEVDLKTGYFEIPHVAIGTYRVTVYADGIFGQLEKDDVQVSKTSYGNVPIFEWDEEKASRNAREIWRIGTPDKSTAEFKHGKKPFTKKGLAPAEYRQYWAVFDFPTDFPNGVKYKVGKSNPAEDFNYIHWSVISNVGNFFRNETYHENVNNWTVLFDLENHQLFRTKTATLTIQFAGAKTGTGTKWANLPYTLNVNGQDVETFIIGSALSSSCGVRSAVSCHNFGHKFSFPSSKLKKGENSFILSLPADAASIETAVLPWTTYIQYDALRLEIE